MLNWIVWNKTVFTFKCVWTKKNYEFMLNWIVWNRTLCRFKKETVFKQMTVYKQKKCTYAKRNCLKLNETI